MNHTDDAHDDEASTDTAQAWDERYSERDQHWSGEPNASLVVEAAGMVPGTALDVGCGEGADAIWLAERGWVVTGLDISAVAIGRAQEAAASAGVSVEWIVGELGVGELGDGDGDPGDGVLAGRSFDLVALHYPALPKHRAEPSLLALLEATAPGGTLLVVGHDFEGSEHGRHHAEERGFDPSDYVQPPDVAAALGEGWTIEVQESRAREVPPGFQGPDVPDVVLRARRDATGL